MWNDGRKFASNAVKWVGAGCLGAKTSRTNLQVSLGGAQGT